MSETIYKFYFHKKIHFGHFNNIPTINLYCFVTICPDFLFSSLRTIWIKKKMMDTNLVKSFTSTEIGDFLIAHNM